MSIPRRFLPSLSALSAFEAVARTGSVTEAARELNRTQGAISRQISALEDQLEVSLFHRERQAMRLTPAGRAYVREIRESLRRIGTASMSLRANPAGGSLSIAAPPAFAARWLMPRLPPFLLMHPEVKLNIVTRETRISFQSESIDAAIYFGDELWRDVERIELQAHEVIPVCNAALKQQYRFKSPGDLRRAPLLHLASWPDGWEQWLQHYRAPSEQVRGMLFDQVITLAAAAVAGIGVALLPPLLFSEELKRSALVPALQLSLTATHRYHLVWPKDRNNYPPLTSFRDWLTSQVND
jgi:LysR family glycine cleavage system transcriptional activator